MIALIVSLAAAATVLGDPCDPPSSGCPTPFGGVGTLVLKGECAFFASESGAQYLITDIGRFSNGDLVWVSGTLLAFCPADCAPISGCIPGNIIAKPFQGCGTLNIGPQGCTVFVADSGEGYFLENEEGFALGARVYVEGGIDLQSPFCQPFVVSGLQDNSIESCFEVCGTLSIGPQSCTLVVAEGQGYAIENVDGSMFGDEVLVSGKLNPDSLACFPAMVPAIENNSIGVCLIDADLNGDGTVNGADLALLLGNWNGKGLGDLDGNGVVDSADLSILLGAWSERVG